MNCLDDKQIFYWIKQMLLNDCSLVANRREYINHQIYIC